MLYTWNIRRYRCSEWIPISLLLACCALWSCTFPMGESGAGQGPDAGGDPWADPAGAGQQRGDQPAVDGGARSPDAVGSRGAGQSGRAAGDTGRTAADTGTRTAPDATGTPAADAGASSPGTSAPDSGGTSSTDAGGTPEPDAGTTPAADVAGSPGADAGGAADAGSAAPIDAGATTPDAGATALDTGATTPDTGGSVADPALPGAHSWTQSQLNLATPGGQVPVTAFVPKGGGKLPLVIFLHGFSLTPNLYVSYGEHLASHGWLVLLPKLPGNVLMPTPHAKLAKTVMALLDQLLSAQSPLGGIDSKRIALVGHSMGGKVAMLTAAQDSRVKAVFGVDPVDSAPPFGANPVDYPSVTPELMGDIKVAVGALGETVNAKPGLGGQACAPAAENFQQYFKHASGPALQVEVIGAGHMAFLDQPNCGLMCMACSAGPTPAATARKLARRYLTAFVGHTVLGESGWTAWMSGVQAQADVQAGLVTLATKGGL